MLWAWLILIIGGLALWLLENQSLKNPEQKITYDVAFKQRRMEPKQPAELEIKISNRGRLPVFYLEYIQNFAAGLIPYSENIIPADIRTEKNISHTKQESNITNDVPNSRADFLSENHSNKKYIEMADGHYSIFAGTASIRDACYVPGRKTITRSYSLTAEKRGCYRISGSHISVGDFMGIRQSLFSLNLNGELLVLPERSHRRDLPVTMANILGDLSVQRFLYEDPMMTVGFSDYTGREPQKSISWMASARAGRMLVKKYDHTAERTVTLLLNIEKAGDELEECFRLTRSICEELEHARIGFSFCTNANLFSSQGVSGGAQGSGQMHLNAILDGLARANGSIICSADKLIGKLCRSDLYTAGYLIIQGTAQPELMGKLRELRAASGSVIYLLYAKGGGERC